MCTCKQRETGRKRGSPQILDEKDSLGQKGQCGINPGWGWRALWGAGQGQGAEKTGRPSLRCSAGPLHALTKPNKDLKLLLSQIVHAQILGLSTTQSAKPLSKQHLKERTREALSTAPLAHLLGKFISSDPCKDTPPGLATRTGLSCHSEAGGAGYQVTH